MADFFSFYYLAAFLALYTFTKHLLHKIQNLPPSPFPSFPIIGHLYLLKKPLHRTLSTLSNKHGHLLFLHFGSRPVVVVASPALAEECLAKNDVIFANRPRLTVGDYLGYNYTSIAWSSYGDHWRNLRRISSLELLSTHRLQLLSAIRLEEVKLMIHSLACKGSSAVVEMRTVFSELSLNIIMRMIAGKRYYGDKVTDLEEARQFREIINETVKMAGKSYLRDFIPFLGWIGLGGKVEELEELHRKRDGFLQNLIQEHKRRLGSGSPFSGTVRKTMIEVLLSLQEKEPEYYKDETIRSLMLVLLLGAVETSVNTMEWALSLLLNHPKVLNEARIEIDKQVGHDHLINESDMAQLPYLCSVINETLRMYPPLPLALPHESSGWSTVGGFRVPPGTMLIVNLWGIQNDPKIWADPEKFRPERFREGDGDGLKFMPFSSGRRSCPGEGLAMRVVGLALGSLIQCFEWSRISEESVDMREGNTVTISRAQPLQARCQARSAMMNLLSQFEQL